jgi:hypothetical protein
MLSVMDLRAQIPKEYGPKRGSLRRLLSLQILPSLQKHIEKLDFQNEYNGIDFTLYYKGTLR